MEGLLGPIGMILAIVVLVVTVFKGLHPLIAALIATLVAIFANGVPVWETLIKGFGTGMTGFMQNFTIMFLMGSIFGELMSRSKYARAIALKLVDIFGEKRGIVIVVVTTWILNYSGVSVFVIIFAIYPIALYVFQQSDIPKKIIPAVVTLGAGTLTMTMLPGTPALTNVIPTQHLGTDIYAAPVLGIILAVIAGALGLLYLHWLARRWKAAGEHFVPGEKDEIEVIDENTRKSTPSFVLAVIPIAIIFFGNIIFTQMKINSNAGVCLSLLIASAYIVLTTWGTTTPKEKMESFNKAAQGAMFAIINTAAIIGFAGALRTFGSFQNFLDFATSLDFAPLLSAVLAMDIICAITASSTGGIAIFMELLGKHFLDMGVNAQQLHRLTAVAAGTLDSLPHAGPNATFMSVCGLTYKEGYPPLFVITCVIPLICQFIGVALASMGIV